VLPAAVTYLRAADRHAVETTADLRVEQGATSADDELRRTPIGKAQQLENVHVSGEREVDSFRQLAVRRFQRLLERLVEGEVAADPPDRAMAQKPCASCRLKARKLGRIASAVASTLAATVVRLARVEDDKR
jgi:hypothetical protein